MRFVFVTDELPKAGAAGHLAMNHAIIAWLQSRGQQVEILLVRPRLRWPAEVYDLAPVTGFGVKKWRKLIFVDRFGTAFGILARNLLGLAPLALRSFLIRRARWRAYGMADTVLGAFLNPGQCRWCAGRILQLAPDTVLIDTIFRAAVLREPMLKGLHGVIIAHDVFYLRHQALLAAGYMVHPPALSREMEAGLLDGADAIAAIQPEEAALIRAMCPGRLVCITPMPAIACPRPAATARLAGRLVFVGSAPMPNIDGLRWFFSEIWPLLRDPGDRIGDPVTLDLVGDCGAAMGRLPPGVRRLGRIENLPEVLHRASLAIAPLRVGSGLKIKMLDYARHGLTTVATPESLQGFAESQDAPFIMAPDAAAFSRAVTAELRSAGKTGEDRALRYITAYYGLNRSFAGLAAALNMPAETAPE